MGNPSLYCARSKNLVREAADVRPKGLPFVMEAAMPIGSNDLVDDVMRQWPSTIRIFLNHRMRCVGCPIGCFHTVDDACREHDVDLSVVLAELNDIARQNPVPMQSCISARWPHEPRT
jgi:hybrid cluster-associated redox disulfide protein